MLSTRQIVSLLATIPFALVGCKQRNRDTQGAAASALAPAPSAANPEATWKTPAGAALKWQDTSFELPETTVGGSVSSEDMSVKVSLSGAPKGTKLKVGDTEVVVESWTTELTRSLAPQVASLSPEVLESEAFPVQVDALQLVFPDEGVVSAKVPAIEVSRSQLTSALENVAGGNPLPFGADARGSATYVLPALAPLGTPERELVIGKPKALGQISRVASHRELGKEPTGVMCKGASGDDEELHVVTYEVSLFATSDGKLVAKKVFPGEKKCPESWAKGHGANSRPDYKTIVAWIKST